MNTQVRTSQTATPRAIRHSPATAGKAQCAAAKRQADPMPMMPSTMPKYAAGMGKYPSSGVRARSAISASMYLKDYPF